MKIGILGSGVVGQQLGQGFLRLGHEVMIGTRHPHKLDTWLEIAGEKALLGTFEATAKFGELLVVAIKWSGLQQALEMAGPGHFSGKVVIDTTNPLDSTAQPPRFIATQGHSAGETVQRLLPTAQVVKAFNTVSAYTMCNPVLDEGVPDLFVCGNDDRAKQLVSIFAREWKWHSVIDLGGIEEAFFQEALAHIWIQYGYRNNSWTHAFKLLRK